MTSYRKFTDAELVISFKLGDKIAFDEIYERYWKKLYNETFKRLKRMEIVEEIVQDVFTDLWQKREVKEIDNLYPYLLIAVRYQVYSNYKKGKSTPQFEEPLEHMALSHLQADSLLNLKDLKGCIAIWLAMQPAKRAEIFRLKYMEEYSTREISVMLGISIKTVQNQLLTSFASLRDFLNKLMIILSLA
ncbi:RNA polymerase sigma factor [Pedobacter sp. L105]|uniref:RNA polymerase sigma factor n=1 Tax=Pedobacter sp. L105 TaxID=1641871 RepID=UPI00131ED020|nr:sigma-70 family RNA polymerase sigma factor [Pedobacter sp. L105]